MRGAEEKNAKMSGKKFKEDEADEGLGNFENCPSSYGMHSQRVVAAKRTKGDVPWYSPQKNLNFKI